MRTALAAKVRDEFTRQMKVHHPAFGATKAVSIPPGWRAYRWDLSALACFLVLNVHQYEDAFTVEVAWSKTGNWIGASAPVPVTVPEAIDQPSVLFRIGLFWPPNQDYWWYLGPSLREFHVNDAGDLMSADVRLEDYSPTLAAITRIAPQVSDAMSKISEHVIPYFLRIASKIPVRKEG